MKNEMRERAVISSAGSRQPRCALEPQAFSLESMEQWALERTAGVAMDRFCVTSFWNLDFTIQHTPGDRRTHYSGRLAQSENYGIAFNLASILQIGSQTVAVRADDQSFVGEDSRAILREARYGSDIDRTALIDLVIGHTCGQENGRVTVNGLRHAKYAHKSRIFADEAELILRRKGKVSIKGSKPHVLVIGAMAGTHAALTTLGFEVTATDMSPDVVGQNLGGVMVSGGAENDRHIAAADLIIVTGMALPNRTLESIMETAKANNTSTMIWAVSGRNCGSYYIEHGVDCVISDPLPFLMLPGPASIAIWRREL
jgi:Putative heavy-metal chelation